MLRSLSDSIMIEVGPGETRTLTGMVDEDVSLKPNSTLILNNATVKGTITGDKSTTVKTVGQVSLEGNVTCGNLSLG